MIVVHHLGPPYGFSERGYDAFALGQGVSFFFVLSGFILAYAHPSIDSLSEARLFWLDRIARIWPAHMATLLVAMVALAIPITWMLPLNATLIQAWVPLRASYFSYNAVSWSISTEMAFYAVFPLLIYRWETTGWWKIAAAAGVTLATILVCDLLRLPDYYTGGSGVTVHGLVYINPLGRILEFATGVACGKVFLSLRDRWTPSPTTATALELLALTAVVVTLSPAIRVPLLPYVGLGAKEWLQQSSGFLSFAALILVCAFGTGMLARFSALPLLVRLGEISFALYLCHRIIQQLYLRLFPVAPGTTAYLGAVVSTLAALAAAYVLWSVVEVPMRRRIRSLARGDMRKRPLPTTPQHFESAINQPAPRR